MLDRLKQVDVSAIADLARIKKEELVLRDRLATMELKKEKVSSVVYQRVRNDYESRQATLDAESRPLKARARQEYAKLQEVRGEIERALEEMTLGKEELEFRQELGEFPIEQFRDRLAECERELSERSQQLEEVMSLRERFVAAFHSEQELEVPSGEGEQTTSLDAMAVVRPLAPASSAPVRPAAAAPVPASPEATSPGPGVTKKPAARAVEKVPASPESGAGSSVPAPSADATVVGFQANAAATPPPASSFAAPAARATPTRALAMPRVVALVNNQPTKEYALKTGITSIGRSPKNQIHFQQPDISRHHANIELTPEGYRLTDLGAENGVYVNGRRVKEHRLADGDIIQIGTQQLVYRD